MTLLLVAGDSAEIALCFPRYATSLACVGEDWRHRNKKFVMRFGGELPSPKLADRDVNTITPLSSLEHFCNKESHDG